MPQARAPFLEGPPASQVDASLTGKAFESCSCRSRGGPTGPGEGREVPGRSRGGLGGPGEVPGRFRGGPGEVREVPGSQVWSGVVGGE